MKKSFKFYALIWAILLAVWCAVVFLVRPVIPGFVINYDARFWIAFAFVAAAFVGNLICAYFAFKADNLKKMFYNLPLITVSWSALIAILVAGSALMLIPNCPAWIAAVVCIVLTVDTESILARAKSDAVKAECKKVYEAIRYSDPMSGDALSLIEAKITAKIDELSAAVSADDAEKAKGIADEIVILVADRKNKCKALK